LECNKKRHLVGMVQELDHCRFGVAGHGGTHALQKPIIAELSLRNSLIVSVAP
jgi:hypothetical protein